METKAKQTTYAIVVIIVAIVLGYYLYQDFSLQNRIGTGVLDKDNTVVSAEDETKSETGNTGSSLPDFSSGNIPPPNIDAPIVFYVDIPIEAQTIYRNEIQNTLDALRADNSSFLSWNDLGILRKVIGDYEGAREVWEYAGAISPLNNVSFFNLGDLYHFYLKDYVQAEKNFLIAKKNNRTYIPTYRALYDLYTLSYKQHTSAAEDVLLEGLQYNPDELNLLVLLAGYYKEKGRIAEARLYYERAHTEATRLNNQSMITLLQGELQNL